MEHTHSFHLHKLTALLCTFVLAQTLCSIFIHWMNPHKFAALLCASCSHNLHATFMLLLMYWLHLPKLTTILCAFVIVWRSCHLHSLLALYLFAPGDIILSSTYMMRLCAPESENRENLSSFKQFSSQLAHRPFFYFVTTLKLLTKFSFGFKR